MSPDSRLSEWRITRGTRGLVTMLDVNTGSVGASSAPSRNDSVHESPTSRRADAATMIVVSGIAEHELAQRQMPLALEHLALDLEAVAKQDHDQRREREILDEARARAEVDPVEAAVADREAREHEQRREREHRAARETRDERACHQQQAERGRCRLERGHRRLASHVGADGPLRRLRRWISLHAGRVYWAIDPAKLRQRRGSVMAAKNRINKAGEAARAAQRNRYLQRLLEDEELRGTLVTAYGAARSAYGRMTNGKPATEALFEDRKLQRELKEAANALRDASSSLRESPKRRRKGGIGRSLLLVGVAGVLAVALNEGLRSKVLDLLFGAEEQFDYSSTTAPAEPAPAGASA